MPPFLSIRSIIERLQKVCTTKVKFSILRMNLIAELIAYACSFVSIMPKLSNGKSLTIFDMVTKKNTMRMTKIIRTSSRNNPLSRSGWRIGVADSQPLASPHGAFGKYAGDIILSISQTA